MHSIKLSLIILQITLLAYKNKIQCCTAVSFNDVDVSVYYQRRGWKNVRVSECVSSLTTVLENEYTGVAQKIKINNQFVSVLNKQVITDFSEVYAIELQNNNITAVKNGALNNLPMLKYLYLSENQISHLENEAISNLPELQYLFLQENRLPYFDQHWLNNVSELEILFLTHNLIQNIPANSFTNLPKLLSVYLAHNRISHIHDKAFEGLPKLLLLDLSYNKINYLPPNIFKPTAMGALNLYGNHIIDLSDEVLNSMLELKELIIAYNPVTCECYFKILEWAARNGVDMTNQKLVCEKISDARNIAACVETNETVCVPNSKQDVFNILHLEQPDYGCHREMGYLETLSKNCCL